jgi:hypothetical protein
MIEREHHFALPEFSDWRDPSAARSICGDDWQWQLNSRARILAFSRTPVKPKRNLRACI